MSRSSEPYKKKAIIMKRIVHNSPRRHSCLLRLPAVPFILTMTLLAIVTNAAADTILIDDFSNPNLDGWTHVDSNVGKPWGPGIVDVSGGSLLLTTTDEVPANADGHGYQFLRWDESTDPKFSDGFLRAKIRVDTVEGVAAMLFRYSGDLASGFNGYSFTAIAGRTMVYNKIQGNQVVQERAVPGFAFDPGHEWWVEGGAIGNQITMKFWQDGDPEPEEPQLSIRDSTFSEGWFGLDANMNFSVPTRGFPDVTYDDVYFTFPSVLGDFDDDGQLLASDINLLSNALGSMDTEDLDRYGPGR